VLSVAPRGGRTPRRLDELSLPQIGQVTRVGIDERAIWVSGSTGLVVQSRGTGALRVMRVPSELPGPVLDVVADANWMWVGTPQGLIRLRRTNDGVIW
jgi:ligand-binding sensor domain-containing protein